MHLKTSLILSLALLLGTAPGFAEAQSSRRTSSVSARKAKKSSRTSKSRKKKKKTPPPAPEEPTAASATDPEAPPVEATAATLTEPASAPVEPASAPVEPPVAPTPAATMASSTEALPLPPPPAATGHVVVLAVPAEAGAAESATALETDLRGALGDRPDVQLVDLASALPAPEPASAQQGDTLFNEGKTLYDNLDPDAAAKKFIEAADFYQQHPVATNAERLGRVYIFLGAARLLNGNAEEAQEAFIRALLAEPTIQPESKLFGQDVVEAFEAAQGAFARLPRGTLAVDSMPVGAQVSLHGQSVGTTPLEGVELAAGPHQVVLTLPGYAPFGAFQPVRSGQDNALRATLVPSPGLAEVQSLAAQASTPQALRSGGLPPQVATVGERLGARYVVIARVTQDRRGRVESELYAWDVQTKNHLRGLEFRSDE
ncbi:MAG TPA: PEGA domain-containing protein, partial [Myxococcaceae bacterium]|nr:PEGA domain-containing protein [Myxococcaceae bacterium]